MDRRLYRSRTDRMIAGVCGGLAEQWRIDPTLLRIAVALLALATHGGVLLAYLVMAIVVPEQPFATGETDLPLTPETPAAGQEEDIMAEDVSSEPMHEPTPEVPSAPEPPAAPFYAQPTVPQARRRVRRGGVGFGVVLVLLGLTLLANQFIPDFDIWKYWPVALILVGAASIVRGLRG